MQSQKRGKGSMYSRNYQGSEDRRRQSAPIGYGNTEELRRSLLVPPDYRGELLRRPQAPVDNEERVGGKSPQVAEGAPQYTAREKHAVFTRRDPAAQAEKPSDADMIEEAPLQEEIYTAPPHKAGAGGLISEISSLLFGRSGEEDALLILGVGLLLMNSRMERGKTPLFSGGHLHPEEDDIGLFLILLLLFS